MIESSNRGLSLDDINISLEGKALVSLSAHVSSGDILSIMGSSGSGKSTLLAYIGGFLDRAFLASGNIVLNGQNLNKVPAAKRRFGILFQDSLLLPHLNVGQNLIFAIPSTQKGTANRRELANKALAEVGLDGYFDKDPETLSGGQKARVALMRTLLSDPQALLLDEPFSKLDADRRQQLRELVFQLAKDRQLPTILVTHDLADAEAACGTIISPLNN